MNVLSLFSGIGALDLGLEWAGMRTVAFCERDHACRHWLAQHWPGVPIHEDVTTLSGEPFRGRVDIIAGGFPCQPFSVAGKQKGKEDERHLWPHFARLIREIRPRWVLAENVPGLRTIAADLVLEDLEEQGYTCWPLVVGADDVYAPHRRKRVWIVGRLGLADADRSRERDADEPRGIEWPGWAGASHAGRGGHDVGDDEEQGWFPGYCAEYEVCHNPNICDGRQCALETLAHSSRDEQSGRPESAGANRERVGPGGHEAMAHRESGGRGADGRASRESGHLDLGDPPLGESASQRLERLRPHTGESQESQSRHTGPQRWPARPGEPQHVWEAPRLAHTTKQRRDGRARPDARGRDEEAGHRAGPEGGGGGEPGRGEEGRTSSRGRGSGAGISESSMGHPTDGTPGRMAVFSPAHRREALKALGNSVVPQVVETIGRSIMRADAELSTGTLSKWSRGAA